MIRQAVAALMLFAATANAQSRAAGPFAHALSDLSLK